MIREVAASTDQVTINHLIAVFILSDGGKKVKNVKNHSGNRMAYGYPCRISQ